MDLNKAQGQWLIDRGLCQQNLVDWALQHVRLKPGSDLVEILITHGRITPEFGALARKSALGPIPLKVESNPQHPSPGSDSNLVASQSDFTETVGLDNKSDRLHFDLSTKRVGPYKLGEELGRGGMGVVYKATHTQLKRTVALKMLLAGPENSRALQRFEIEASSMARLKHPNIVEVFDVALGQDLAYMAMEFIEGSTLSERLERGVTLEEALQIAEKLGRALHHAHRMNIIHRDMKPGNVLLRENGEPALTDFGLAKALDENVGLSQTGTLQGTPAYMSPEQVEGKHARIDGRADIYSLGVTLFEMVMGRLPFEAPTVEQLIAKICVSEAPRAKGKNIPSSVSTIIERCLAKEAFDRYDTAEDFADDCRRVLENKPIEARPVGLFERAHLFRKRNSLLLALFAALLCAASLIGFELYRQKNRELELARSEASLLLESKKSTQASKSREKKRSEQTRQLVNFTFFDVSDSLDHIPGTSEAQRLLLMNGLNYLKSLADETKEKPELQRDLALAYVRMGRFQRKKQDGEFVDKFGAYKSYENALKILNTHKDEQNAEYQRALGFTLYHIADLYYSEKKLKDAEREIDAGIVALRTVAIQLPRKVRSYTELASALHVKAMIEKDLGHVDKAFKILREAAQFLDQGEKYGENDLDYYNCLGSNKLIKSQFHEMDKNIPLALAAMGEAVDTFKKKASEFERRAVFVRNFKAILRERARLALRAGDYELSRSDLIYLGELSDNSYDVKKYRATRREVVGMIEEGERFVGLRDFKKAVSVFGSALTKQRRSVIQCFGQPDSYYALASLHRKLGETTLEMNSSKRLCAIQLNRAESIFSMLIRGVNPVNKNWEFNYAFTLGNQFSLYATRKNTKKALAYIERFRNFTLSRKFIQINPSNVIIYGNNCQRMSTLLYDEGKREKAYFWFEQSATLYRSLGPALRMSDPNYPVLLGILGCRMGQGFFDATQLEKARSCFLLSEEIYDQLIKNFPSKEGYYNNHLLSCRLLALIYEKQGQMTKALEKAKKEMTIVKTLEKNFPAAKVSKLKQRIQERIKRFSQ